MVTHLLITGASGKLGTRLVRSLKGPLSITCLVRNPLSCPFITPLGCDIRTVYANLPKHLPDVQELPANLVVVHLAAITHSTNPKSYTEINTEGTRSVVKLAQSLKAKHFIFISTRAINPKGGTYCASKAKAEEIVRKSSIPYTILRFSEIYGMKGKEGIDQILNQVKETRFVFIPGDGSNKLAPLYFKDAVKAIAESVFTKPKNQTIIITGPEEYTLNDIVIKAMDLYQTHPTVIRIPLWLLRVITPLAALLPKPPIYPDQIDRMLIDKEIASKETLVRLKPKTLNEVIQNG